MLISRFLNSSIEIYFGLTSLLLKPLDAVLILFFFESSVETYELKKKTKRKYLSLLKCD